jgi:hypothetical protein
MDLEKELPEFNELDIEFSKNIETLYNILASNFNKKIKIINILRDNLYEWTKNEIKAYKKWEIGKYAWCGINFPSVNKDKKIEEFPNFDIIGADIYIKIKENCGFNIQIGFYIDKLYWSIGQWWSEYRKGKELFNYNFYKKLKNKLDLKNEKELEVEITYPGTENEDEENKNNKYIEFLIPFTVIDNKKIITVFHKIFKKEVLKTSFEHIK